MTVHMHNEFHKQAAVDDAKQHKPEVVMRASTSLVSAPCHRCCTMAICLHPLRMHELASSIDPRIYLIHDLPQNLNIHSRPPIYGPSKLTKSIAIVRGN